MRDERRGPIRTCVGCRRARSERDLLRIAFVGDHLAVGRALPGRGAWLCRGSASCLRQAVRSHAFSRALRAEVAPGALDELVEVLGHGDDVPESVRG